MLRVLAAAVALSCALPGPPAQDPAPLTLEEIMAHPDWIGREPKRAYWADDSRAVYYSRKREGEEESDLFRLDLESGEAQRLSDAERSRADARGGDFDRARTRKVWSRNGDLFLKDLATGSVTQLTRTDQDESAPAFLADGARVRFRRGGATFVRELETGLETEPAVLRFSDDPLEEDEENEDDEEYLEEQQERLIQTVRTKEERAERARRRERERLVADPTRVRPWYLGDGMESAGANLSPDGRWLLVRIQEESKDKGKRDLMPEFVTDSSWVETREVRAHVGQSDPRAVELVLLDLEMRERFDLDLSVLPGIADDPLAWLGQEEEPDDDAPDPRELSVWTTRWAPDSATVAFLARSIDNKDRWIARVDLDTKAVVPIHHLHDEAWICYRFNELDWLRDASGIWFTSEETGYSQLYFWNAAEDRVRPLTEGEFEIDRVEANPAGDALYFRANATHPGVHEIWRLSVPDGPLEQVTDLGGRTSGSLSPDGKKLLLTHSRPLAPPELYVQDARPGAPARRITQTVTDAFLARPWVEPRLVEIPSRTGATIHARLFLPETPATSPRPAVAFVHGAGYLQNAHAGWSGYFREFMFHSLLVAEGYVVIDVDYRASAGYGRDWRTAIYRGMGPPELEDYEDCVLWLAENHAVDPGRVGVYGGSYGGFLALMGLFTKPDLFACGAALRPVTDWAHYSHGYTSNILNTPELDPEAFEASSPIEFAEGLEKPLLICHGMLDDNVLVKDSIRLAQRLIELEKEDWELALYPVEPHGFREPSSWLDEYRRVFALFEEHLAH